MSVVIGEVILGNTGGRAGQGRTRVKDGLRSRYYNGQQEGYAAGVAGASVILPNPPIARPGPPGALGCLTHGQRTRGCREPLARVTCASESGQHSRKGLVLRGSELDTSSPATKFKWH